jgi:signal transduction histidine kinase
MNLRVHRLGWLVLGGSLIAAILFVVGSTISFRQASVGEQERTLAAEIATSVNGLSAVEWQARTEHVVSTESLRKVRQAHRKIEESFGELLRLDGGGSARTFHAYRAYARLMARELALIRVGRLAAAKTLDHRFVDHRYDALMISIAKQTPILERNARRLVAQARQRLFDALIATGILVALLAWQFALQQKGRRRDREVLRRLQELGRQRDEFVATVSHELRTPLTSIRGYAELLTDEAELNAEQSRWVQVIGRNADRLHTLVTDLLLIAEVNAGKFALDLGTVDLTAAVAEAVEAAAPAAESKGLTLTNHPEVQISLQGDAARLGQVVDNLLSNAIKFTPAGGSVAVRTARHGGAAVLEVADSGVGIAPADQERLFERFYRTDQATQSAIQGTGLGLAISQTIVAAHRGTIAVTSVLGVGTTFHVELPAEDAASTVLIDAKPVLSLAS